MDICKVIEYEGDNHTFVWKHPAEDFNTLSQLIVHESQQALFFKDGKALDLFPAGRYTLHTQNIPLLGKLINLPFDGVTPFHCEVYYINMTEQMAVQWGTRNRAQYMDPTYGFPMSIGAAGEMTLAVSDPRKLVVKLVGTEAMLSQEKFISYMRGIINQKVQPYLSAIMQTGKFNIFDVDAHAEEFANELKKRLDPDFGDYGIELRRFMVLNIAKPENDPNYQQLRDLKAQQTLAIGQAELRKNITVIDAQADAQRNVIAAEARAEGRRREGYTYQQERSFDVAQDVASNAAVGEFSNVGIGMGMIGGIGGALSDSVSSMATSAISQAAPQTADTANAEVKPMAPSATAGTMAPTDISSEPDGSSLSSLEEFKNRVEKLKTMHDAGLIDEGEFKTLKAKLIADI